MTGGVAAYKAVELCRRLVELGAYVSPILTDNATRFIGEATFAAVASEAPRTTLWAGPEPSPHTTLGQLADLVIVAPATARLIGAYANGLSGDLLTTTLLATRAPVVVCPAMHTEMWENPAVADNVALLRSRGVKVVGPASGSLAGGDMGVGRLAETGDILSTAASVLSAATDLAGRCVLVTAGGTREPVDAVRYLGNRSSGRQGHALAEVAASRGADVILVTAANVPSSKVITRVDVETAEQMRVAVAEHMGKADIIVMAAAVADFRPVDPAAEKLKKAAGPPEVRLEPTVDILATIAGVKRPDQVVVGFAAETEDVEDNAREKLARKRIDFIAANDVSQTGAGFETETNHVLLFDSGGNRTDTGLVTKAEVAAVILDHANARLAELER